MALKRVAMAVVLAGLMGCGTSLKQAASTLDEVRAEVVADGLPSVHLGVLEGTTGPVEGMVNGVKMLVASKAVAKAIDVEGISQAFVDGLTEGLADGEPFGIGSSAGAPILEVEILDLGLDLPSAGADGLFAYDVRVTLRDRQGNRLYRDRRSCEMPVGDPAALEQALLGSGGFQRPEGTPAQALQQAFEQVARSCAAEVADDLQRRSGTRADEGVVDGIDLEIPEVDLEIPEVDEGRRTVSRSDSGG